MRPYFALLLTGFFIGNGLAEKPDAPASKSSRPPFPETWNPNPLKYNYTAHESLYLSVPPRPKQNNAPAQVRTGTPPAANPVKNSATETHASVTPKPEGLLRDFALPPKGKGSIRVLLQSGVAKFTPSSSSGSRLHWLRLDNTQGEQRFTPGTVKFEFRYGMFQVMGPGKSAFNDVATSLRMSPENPDSPLVVGGKAYRGSLIFSVDGGRLQCVNVLPLEDYLRGVVPLEMGRTGDQGLEALKAQAVVARTYALKYMLGPGNGIFDVRASVQDQVYGGIQAEYPLTDHAIHETMGRVVLSADTLAICYYHSTCGGTTASRNEVWGGPVIPYLITQPDRDTADKPWCSASRYMRWSESWDAADLAAILRKNLSVAGVRNAPAFHRLKDLDVRSRFSDGRINVLEVVTDKGSFELHGDKIRFALKTSKGRMLESSRFDIEMEGNRITARGSGYGHGVGLCQMGALGRSAAGQSYQEILEAYYPGTAVAMTR